MCVEGSELRGANKITLFRYMNRTVEQIRMKRGIGPKWCGPALLFLHTTSLFQVKSQCLLSNSGLWALSVIHAFSYFCARVMGQYCAFTDVDFRHFTRYFLLLTPIYGNKHVNEWLWNRTSSISDRPGSPHSLPVIAHCSDRVIEASAQSIMHLFRSN